MRQFYIVSERVQVFRFFWIEVIQTEAEQRECERLY